MQFQRFASKGFVSLAVFVLLLSVLNGCGPAGSRSGSLVTPAAVGQLSSTPTTQATTAPSSTATPPPPTATTVAMATPPPPTATTAAASATKLAPTATKPPATKPSATTVPTMWKTFTSAKHHYIISFYPPVGPSTFKRPAEWAPDPENVNLRPASASLPAAQIYALKGAPPILGFENCKKNLLFKACRHAAWPCPRVRYLPRSCSSFKRLSHITMSRRNTKCRSSSASLTISLGVSSLYRD